MLIYSSSSSTTMKNIALLATAACLQVALAEVVYYDSFTEKVLTTEEKAARDKAGNSFYCVNAFEQCSETGWRTLDGSCNNLAKPAAGAGHSRFDRFLPAYYNPTDGSSPRWMSGDWFLPNARKVRTRAMAEGRVESKDFTQLAMLFFAFITTDFTAQTTPDTTNYVALHPTCCNPDTTDTLCSPIEVPADDPFLFASDTKCLTLTKPMSYQSQGCINANVTPPYRINYGSPYLDIKHMYGIELATSNRQRRFEGGLLNYTIGVDGLQFPVAPVNPKNPSDGVAGLRGINYVLGVIFWREHNRIAAALANLNPTWDDETLFQTARDINIAEYSQIYYYELLPLFMGYENMIREGVISKKQGLRDPYDASITPGWWTEAMYAYRWSHTLQSGIIDLYTPEGERLIEFESSIVFPGFPVFNTDENLAQFTQGCFRTNVAAHDNIVDPFLGERVLSPGLKVADVFSIDIQKGRLLGLAPYSEYLHFCDGLDHDTFDSLDDYLDEESQKVLRDIYETDTVTSDIELMPAIWREKIYPGSKMPKTVYCLTMKQLHRTIKSDRHWFERPNRPHAFTEQQLLEIRKTSMARIMCDNDSKIPQSGITARAFEPISDSNPIVKCESLPAPNLAAWQKKCNAKKN